MCNEKPICVVLLMGIPGSGKTFFRKFLENFVKVNLDSVLGSVQICSVCYDDHYKVKNPNRLSHNERWRNERLEILKEVNSLILRLMKNDVNNCNIPLINGDIDNPNCCLLLIDDNMYYRSMRYEYFKLAKIHNIGFCQIYFNVPLDDALKCNKNRCIEAQVPDSIIKSMFDKIEPPQLSNYWEKYSITVASFVDFQNLWVLDPILSCVKKALENPFKQNILDFSLRREKSREITNSNALHNVDNVLKELCGILIREKMEEMGKSHSRKISQLYSNKRLDIFRKIKQGMIALPMDLNETVNRDEIDMLRPLLLDLLRK